MQKVRCINPGHNRPKPLNRYKVTILMLNTRQQVWSSEVLGDGLITFAPCHSECDKLKKNPVLLNGHKCRTKINLQPLSGNCDVMECMSEKFSREMRNGKQTNKRTCIYQCKMILFQTNYRFHIVSNDQQTKFYHLWSLKLKKKNHMYIRERLYFLWL